MDAGPFPFTINGDIASITIESNVLSGRLQAAGDWSQKIIPTGASKGWKTSTRGGRRVDCLAPEFIADQLPAQGVDPDPLETYELASVLKGDKFTLLVAVESTNNRLRFTVRYHA